MNTQTNEERIMVLETALRRAGTERDAALRLSQSKAAPTASPLCEYCGTPTDSPNYAYHICIPSPKQLIAELTLTRAALDAARQDAERLAKMLTIAVEVYEKNRSQRNAKARPGKYDTGNVIYIVDSRAALAAHAAATGKGT